MKEKSKNDGFAAILLSIVYSFKSVVIVTECVVIIMTPINAIIVRI